MFGWSYPPGCSGPPEDDTICEVCGGDAEKELENGGCICSLLLTKKEIESLPKKLDSIGNIDDMPVSALQRLFERFSAAACNVRQEQKRRYNLHSCHCSICKKEMTFEEVQSEEINCHGKCREDAIEKMQDYQTNYWRFLEIGAKNH